MQAEVQNTETTQTTQTKPEGAFVASLKRNNKKIRDDRAASISEDTELVYKRQIEDLEMSIKKMRRDQENMLDLSPNEMGYHTKSRSEIFKARSINNAMNPHGINVRESRDSDEHPNSLAIVLGLDETGSMGSVPHFLIKDGLPEIVNKIIKAGEKDPQILFLGIGDHECDESPLQVGQFESSDELLDKWLTDVYLEGNGGGNGGESYMLAWYFAAMHTNIDCFEKRKRKGFLFTIGDEPVLKIISARELKKIMGPGEYSNFTATDLLSKAAEKYNVFHVHVKETLSGSRQHVIDGWGPGEYSNFTATDLLSKAAEKYNVFHVHVKETLSGSRQHVIDGWKQLLHDNLLVADRHEDIAGIIVKTILKETVATTKTKTKTMRAKGE
jgi:hypothetical protein